MTDFHTYLSPFTWRYGSAKMRHIWSETYKRRLWRRIWVALAEVQMSYGLVSKEQLDDLRRHAGQIDIERALEIEADIHHDLMAELRTYADQCRVGGGVLHLGATSMDIKDNADALRLRRSLDLILAGLNDLLSHFLEKVVGWADLTIMGYTHLQPAEATTMGYRIAQYAQDLFLDWQALHARRDEIRGKGFKGAVGTSASFSQLIGAHNLREFESRVMGKLDLRCFEVTTQTSPRKQEYMVISSLAALGASLHKFAFDLRVLQSPAFGELGEPFEHKQVGSSAMPFKRNPIHSEKIDSLARALAQMPRQAWDNAAHSLLERTLDDSANRRTLLPESFLIADELIRVASRLVAGLRLDPQLIERNLKHYAPFAATERVLLALSKAGGDRQFLHERLRHHAMTAWKAVQDGRANPLIEQVCNDPDLNRYLSTEKMKAIFEADLDVGDAPHRARSLAQSIRKELSGSLMTGRGRSVGEPD